jgi:hypothetical protein
LLFLLPFCSFSSFLFFFFFFLFYFIYLFIFFLLQEIGEYQFPLFVSSQQLMLMLDVSLPRPFFERNADGSLCKALPSLELCKGLQDILDGSGEGEDRGECLDTFFS